MRFGNVWTSVAGVGMRCLLLGFTSSAKAGILLHEVLADPSAVGGDANGDGVVSSSEDEFVELYNTADTAIDLSGWILEDAIHARYVFPEKSWIKSQGVYVVFGGGTPDFDSDIADVESTGSLGLNNSGDSIRLLDGNGALIDEFIYGMKEDGISRWSN